MSGTSSRGRPTARGHDVAGAAPRRGERGAATAELVAVLPVLVALVLAMVWLLSLGVAQVRTVDAAREAACGLPRQFRVQPLLQECIMASVNPTISSSKVEGTTVYSPSGDKLGSIDDLVIDKRSGQVRYAALEFGGFLGMGTDRYPLPWDQLKYDTQKDGYVVNVDKAQLERAPRYASDEAPTYNDEYGRKVYDYYGSAWWV